MFRCDVKPTNLSFFLQLTYLFILSGNRLFRKEKGWADFSDLWRRYISASPKLLLGVNLSKLSKSDNQKFVTGNSAVVFTCILGLLQVTLEQLPHLSSTLRKVCSSASLLHAMTIHWRFTFPCSTLSAPRDIISKRCYFQESNETTRNLFAKLSPCWI